LSGNILNNELTNRLAEDSHNNSIGAELLTVGNVRSETKSKTGILKITYL
jgi:hypothetical protein